MLHVLSWKAELENKKTKSFVVRHLNMHGFQHRGKWARENKEVGKELMELEIRKVALKIQTQTDAHLKLSCCILTIASNRHVIM